MLENSIRKLKVIIKMSADAIYKYCHEDRIDILKNGMIRFTQPAADHPLFQDITKSGLNESLLSASFF